MQKGRKIGTAGKQGQAPIPSKDQIFEFVEKCDRYPHANRNKAIMLSFFGLGLRPKECASLKIGDVYDFKQDSLHAELVLLREYTKRGKLRTLPIESELLKKHLLLYIHERQAKNERFKPEQPLFLSQSGKHFSANSIGNLMNELLEKRFGFNRGCTYSGRRFFATSMHENGVGMKTIQILMGHSSISTTQRYVEASVKQKINAMMGVL